MSDQPAAAAAESEPTNDEHTQTPVMEKDTGVILGFAERLIEDPAEAVTSATVIEEDDEEESEERSGEVSHFLFHEVLGSQIGGKPFWLNPCTLPAPARVACPQCSLPMPLLLQLYAPLEQYERAYHRMIYVFCCPNGACHLVKKRTGCFKVLRCQLPKENEIYPSDFVSVDATDEELDAVHERRSILSAKTCQVCGHLGSSRCARCKLVSYCCREHQKLDWANHKLSCVPPSAEDDSSSSKADRLSIADQVQLLRSRAAESTLFPFFELVTEPERLVSSVSKLDAKTAKLLHEYTKSDNQNITEDELKDLPLPDCDPQWLRFQKRVRNSNGPDQVLRYGESSPLWISEAQRPGAEHIRPCTQCGAPRRFEFQIMPQLLFYLQRKDVPLRSPEEVHSELDWGTLAVYTCSESCDATMCIRASSDPESSSLASKEVAVECHTYVEEQLWRQDPHC
mmetsp:Transcript_48089/g.121046  ORF Transcript_48089/g.121046 Transcript_48089/m.121046 type:complete len:454 (+) Transcript_48089:113-1474(+)